MGEAGNRKKGRGDGYRSGALIRAIAAAIVVLAGCGEATGPHIDGIAPPGLDLHVAGGPFGLGDTIRMNLSNNTDNELGYNLCVADLERWIARRWLVVQRLPEGAGCTGELNRLPPGESAFGLQLVYPFIDSGVYRFRDQVEWPLGSSLVEVVSNTFRIAGE